MVTMIFATGLAGGLGAPLVTAISRSEGVSLAVAQWSVTGSLLVAAVAAPIVGRLGSGGRQRTVLVVLMAAGTVGTLMAALPWGIGALLAGRALQGLALASQALMMTVGRNALPADREVAGVSTLTVAIVTSAGLGFPVSALLGQSVGVHGAFWFGVALLALSLVIAVLVVPPGGQSAPAKFDVTGAWLLGSGTLAVLLAISQSRAWGYTSPAVLGLAAFGVLTLAVTGWWLLRVADPLVDLRLMRHPVVLACHVAGLLCGMGMYMLMTLSLLIGQASPAQHGLGLSIATAGLLMLPYSVASVVGNKAGIKVARHLDTPWVTVAGCLIFGMALLGLAFWHHEPWQLFVAMSVGGMGSGLVFTSLPILIMRVVPPAEVASALSFNIVMRFVGFSTGSVIAVALLEVVDGHAITHTGASLAAGVAALSCFAAAGLSAAIFFRGRGASLRA